MRWEHERQLQARHRTQASATARAASTFPGMPNRRSRLDHRTLHPRDYCLDPFRYGHDPAAQFHLPPVGDRTSLEVARIQHRLACLLRSHPDPGRAGRLTVVFGFSKQYWSLCTSGQAWMGETVLAAAISAVLALQDRPPSA
ncbi:MAG: hypothetical protein ACXVGA_04375 [Mycobacteriaceae bacterium]